VYGPGQLYHFIPEFVEKLKNGIFTVQGGAETRSFCYVSDALDAALQLMQNSHCYNKTINIGNSTETTIKQVAELIAKKMNIDSELTVTDGVPGSVSRRCPDLDLIKQLILWAPKITLEHGINLTLESL
jgi:nucleoside-diphosphate-sugar epimerase